MYFRIILHCVFTFYSIQVGKNKLQYRVKLLELLKV